MKVRVKGMLTATTYNFAEELSCFIKLLKTHICRQHIAMQYMMIEIDIWTAKSISGFQNTTVAASRSEHYQISIKLKVKKQYLDAFSEELWCNCYTPSGAGINFALTTFRIISPLDEIPGEIRRTINVKVQY
ncbi:hypothetical protein LOAG_08924 [Loa loa]|uniref:Uncharacterized protein n=1 Tax=Loa loa TaxID=7209 RepID=A0A1S0TTC8_LOALO|nr:hypothetical protein LOAG_08924 [Loa loa]EFO19566.1 hypothetical protein LOAG_08924 [Loa loa]